MSSTSYTHSIAPGPFTPEQQELFDSHVKYATKVATELWHREKRRVRGTSLDDYINWGLCGLARAVQTFDTERGKFLTLVAYKVRFAIRDALGLRKDAPLRNRVRLETWDPKNMTHPEAPVEKRHDAVEFAKMLDGLSDRQKHIVTEHYVAGKPLWSIAGEIGMSHTYVNQQHRNALQIMRARLTPIGEPANA